MSKGKKCDEKCKKCDEVRREKETLRVGTFRNIKCSRGRKILIRKRPSGETTVAYA